jgi:hypothetical protein
MQDTTRDKYIRIIIRAEYQNRRFTVRELAERLCHELHPGEDHRISIRGIVRGDYFVRNPSPYKSMREDVNRALYSQRDKNDLRYFFHSVKPIKKPIWFYRDIATSLEIMRFADYLRQQGEALREEAKTLLEWASTSGKL